MSEVEETPEWMEHARCADLDTDLFFPTKGESRKGERAKGTCFSCPVREECLQYALDAPFAVVGIWGGTNVRERWALKKDMKPYRAA